jgi:hypothetical protein
MNNELDKFIMKTLRENYDNDYNAFDTSDLDLFCDFPLNLFYDNKNFLTNLEMAKINIHFNRKMIRKIIKYFKDNAEEDEVREAIRSGDISQLSMYYAIAVANKFCRGIQKNKME